MSDFKLESFISVVDMPNIYVFFLMATTVGNAPVPLDYS